MLRAGRYEGRRTIDEGRDRGNNRMRKILFLLIVCLFLVAKSNSWAFDPKDFGIEGFEDKVKKEKNSFIGIALGQHNSSLSSYNNNIEQLNKDPVLSALGYEMNKLQGNALDGKISFGYRINNNALVLGVGFFDKVKTNSKWGDGSTGEASISTFFLDLTYKYYLKSLFEGMVDYEVGTLVPYFGGGVGWYFVNWTFYDPYLVWVAEGSEEENQNITGKGNDFGFHVVGGMDFFISKKCSLNLQIDYLHTVIKQITAKMQKEEDVITEWVVYFGDEKLKIDLSGVSILLGINYHL